MNKWLLLAYSLVMILIGGGIMLYGLSMEVPNTTPFRWGLLVMGYMTFGVMGTGISTYNSMYELLHRHARASNPLRGIGTRAEWLALAALVPGWIMVFASVYKPLSLSYIFSPSFNPTSRIAWNGVLYVLVAIGIILALVAWIAEGKREKVGKVDPLLRLVLALASGIAAYAVLVELLLDANLGGVFGYLSTWVVEFGPFMSILFVALAFYGGIALLSIAAAVRGRGEHEEAYRVMARDGMFASLGVSFMILWWAWLMGTNQETAPWMQALLSGQYAALFWGPVVLIGLLAPIMLYAASYAGAAGRGALVVASALAIVGMFSIIAFSVLLPQSITWYYSTSPISPIGSVFVEGLRTPFTGASPWTTLSFSLDQHDLYIFVGAGLFALGLYPIGSLILPLDESDRPRHWIFK